MSAHPSAVVVAHVVDVDLLDTPDAAVVVDTGPEPARGRTHVDLSAITDWKRNCRGAVGIDSERFLDLLITRITALG